MKLIDVKKYDPVFIRPRKKCLTVRNYSVFVIEVGAIERVQFLGWKDYKTVTIVWHSVAVDIDVNDFDFFLLDLLDIK